MNWERDPSMDVESWQVVDYRQQSTEELLKALSIGREQFDLYVEAHDSPEELTETICPDDLDAKGEDQLYLVVFELWRRLHPERLTLSLFCDELDHRIAQGDGESVSDALALLVEILGDLTDEGKSAKEAFELITDHLAHDLPTFLRNFIDDEIQIGNESYATELLEDFVPYLENDPWLCYLQVKLLAKDDPEQGEEGMKILLEELGEEEPHLKEQIQAFLAVGS